MKTNKTFFLILVMVAAIFWGGPGAQASQITFNYTVVCPDTLTTFFGNSDSWAYRYRYDLTDVSGNSSPELINGTLVGSPTGPGHFKQQITIPGVLAVSVYTYVATSEKGPDLLSLPLTHLDINTLDGSSVLSLDQTGPLRFVDAHWSVSVRQDGVVHSFYDVDADTDLLLNGGDFLYPDPPFGSYGLGSSIDVPINWVDTSMDPNLHYWYGEGSAAINFDLIITQEGNVVPLPGTLVLFGSGLLGCLGWRLKVGSHFKTPLFCHPERRRRV